LTLLNAARWATLWPCDPGGRRALFAQAGCVDHAHCLGGVQRGRHRDA
jgi:hypothetical protein